MSIAREQCAAVLVTRGNVDLSPVLASLEGFGDVVVWDNSRRPERSVYGRYLALAEARHQVIYTQDDDCLVDIDDVLAAYERGLVVCNMPKGRWSEYRSCALVGWGSVFDRRLAEEAFVAYSGSGLPSDGLLLNECDRWFTAVNRRKLIDVPFRHLPHAHGADRMGRRRDHLRDRARMLQRADKFLNGHFILSA